MRCYSLSDVDHDCAMCIPSFCRLQMPLQMPFLCVANAVLISDVECYSPTRGTKLQILIQDDATKYAYATALQLLLGIFVLLHSIIFIIDVSLIGLLR